VRFASAAPYAVCAYCRSLLVRRDAGLESLGRVAAVPEDFSPLQLGTSGEFDRRPFTLVGRIRKVWSEGSWNEWCAHFGDGSLGWLAEAQGDLVMTFERGAATMRPPLGASTATDLMPASFVALDGQRFQVSDIKEVACAGAEGELASYAADTGPMTCIDLRGPGLAFATIERSDALRLFVGRYVEFAECRFSHLKPMDGWTLGSSPPAR